MVSRVKGKHVRPDRSSQDPEPDSDVAVTSSGSDCNCSNPIGFRFVFNESAQTPNLNPNFDANVLDHYTDEKVKDFMLKNLELLYKEAISELVSLGCDENIVLAAVHRRLENEDSSTSFENDCKVSIEALSMKNEECTESILKKFQDMNINDKDTDFVPEDYKDEMLESLVKEIKHLEVQVRERRKWADEKAVQAARKLFDDRNELEKLRKERKDYERIRQEKSNLDINHPTVKRLIDEEIGLREASGKVDRALVTVRCLEVENMRLRAETVAAQLTSSEYVTSSSEAAKREKKHLKKIVAWEKQRSKLQEEITSVKQKLIELQEEVIQVEAANKSAEAKWREEQESKKQALASVKQERRLKEQTKLNNKRMHESLRVKIDLDFKCHKDDIQRLEQELSRVKSLTEPDRDLTSLFGPDFEDDTIGKLLHGSGDESDDTDDTIDHECVICGQNEVGVIFLPCAHEVICADCNEDLKKDECPSCGLAIEQRIRVFSGSS